MLFFVCIIFCMSIPALLGQGVTGDIEKYKEIAAKARTSKLNGHGVNQRVVKLAKIFNTLGHTTGAEVGVWQGSMAAGILNSVKSIKTYYLVDPWKHLENWNKPFNKQNDEFERVYSTAMNVTQQWAATKRVVLRGESRKMAEKVTDKSLDFVYIDGDHSARGTVIDVLSWWPKLKLGGILYGDDYLDSLQHGKKFDPTMVKSIIDGFVEVTQVPFFNLGGNQYMIIKTKH